MSDVKDLLYNQILSELTGLKTNVIANYEKNMKKRKNNVFLLFSDDNMKKYMALGRSVDSQLGNRIQRISFFITRMRYGIYNVPNIVEINITDEKERNIECVLYSVDFDLPSNEQLKDFNPYKQYICINTNYSEKKIKSMLKISAKSKREPLKKKRYTFSGISNEAMAELKKKSVGNKKVEVDLLFFNCVDDTLNKVSAFETKMGGNLDTKNAKSNADKVENLYKLFGFIQNRYSYFATNYGECSEAVKNSVKDIENDCCLVLDSKKFWEMIIPDDKFTYDNFIDIYKMAFRNSELEEELKKLQFSDTNQ